MPPSTSLRSYGRPLAATRRQNSSTSGPLPSLNRVKNACSRDRSPASVMVPVTFPGRRWPRTISLISRSKRASPESDWTSPAMSIAWTNISARSQYLALDTERAATNASVAVGHQSGSQKVPEGRAAASSCGCSGAGKQHIVAATTDTSRTARLLALMKKGDDAFNARDFATVDTVHHPDMVAYVTGLAEPIYGKEAHAAFIQQQYLRIFPDAHVYSDPYPIQFGSGDWITVVTRATGTFTGEMTLPDGTVIPPTDKAFDVELGQTTKWAGDQLIVISAFWDAALQRRQIGLA